MGRDKERASETETLREKTRYFLDTYIGPYICGAFEYRTEFVGFNLGHIG